MQIRSAGIYCANDDPVAADLDDPNLLAALDERTIGHHIQVFFTEDGLTSWAQGRIGHAPVTHIGLDVPCRGQRRRFRSVLAPAPLVAAAGVRSTSRFRNGSEP